MPELQDDMGLEPAMELDKPKLIEEAGEKFRESYDAFVKGTDKLADSALVEKLEDAGEEHIELYRGLMENLYDMGLRYNNELQILSEKERLYEDAGLSPSGIDSLLELYGALTEATEFIERTQLLAYLECAYKLVLKARNEEKLENKKQAKKVVIDASNGYEGFKGRMHGKEYAYDSFEKSMKILENINYSKRLS